jgi:hypothetical protein
VNKNTVLRSLQVLRDEGLLEFRRGRGISVAGTPERDAVVQRARELVEFARSQGYRLDELVEIIEDVGRRTRRCDAARDSSGTTTRARSHSDAGRSGCSTRARGRCSPSSACPRSQGVPGSMSSPQRAQFTRPAATIGANSFRNLRCGPRSYLRARSLLRAFAFIAGYRGTLR